MNTFEWNPAFGPIACTLLIVIVGVGLFLSFQQLEQRQGSAVAWRLLWPKMVVAGLIFLALFDPLLKLVGTNATPARVVVLEDISSSMDLKDDGHSSRSARAGQAIQELQSFLPSNVHLQVLPFDTAIHETNYRAPDHGERGTEYRGNHPVDQRSGRSSGC